MMMKPHKAFLGTLALLFCFCVVGCGDKTNQSEAEFKSGLDESIKAAEKGKELMKDASKKR